MFTTPTDEEGRMKTVIATLNMPISEGGTNSNYMHNLAISQSYKGLKLLLSDTKFITTLNSMLIHHIFQEN